MYVSIKDVAARAGVSFQTVAKILSDRAVSVSPATRERVIAVAEELGYVPNAMARGLVTRNSCSIGIVADDLGDWTVARFVVGAEREARTHGHGVLVSTASPSSGRPGAAVRELLEHRVDGVVVAAPRLEDDAALAQLLRTGVPAVSLQHVPGGGVPLVGSDHRLVGRMAAEHLLAIGRRRLATVTGPASRHVVSSRVHGFRQALQSAGRRLPARRIVEADWSAEGGYRAAQALLSRKPWPDGIFAHSDLAAMGVLLALSEHRIAVPDDIAVVGCDDLPIAAYTVPPLTTIRIPVHDTGARAVSVLLDLIAQRANAATREVSEPGSRRELLPVELIVRGSTVPDGTHHRP